MKVSVFCGAGISEESGLATFRESEDSLWSKYDINKICNLLTFKENKELVFNFYNQLKEEILSKKPNKAHFDLAKFQNNHTNEVFILTSNLDNLLEKAGCKNVIHLHDDMSGMRCLGCANEWHIGNKKYNLDERCPKCNSKLIKPSVIFFNERAPKYTHLKRIFQNRYELHYKLIIGTSFNVLNEQSFGLEESHRRQHAILVNKTKTEKEYLFDYVFKENASTGVEKAIQIIKNQIYP